MVVQKSKREIVSYSTACVLGIESTIHSGGNARGDLAAYF